MSTHGYFDRICCAVLVFTLILTVLFMDAGHLGIQKASAAMGYEKALFDTSRVHSIDIIMDDWDTFIANCKNKEYHDCTVIIDNETYKNVAIRAKGNTSLSQVTNDRYSYKIEFDHYDAANTYHGLDKLCLNNIIQDNTYMKDHLTYQMMGAMGVAAPLSSYAYIMVNGADWGLYLAVEGVEGSFLQRNYGKDHGALYKPDSMRIDGGRGNGERSDRPQIPSGDREGTANGQMPGGRGMGMGSDDVLLKYIDDDIESYPNIFENAKTDITDSDKARLINALKKLNNGEDLESTVDIDAVIRYFVVHDFVLNFDSYTGAMIHNYYLYEDNGQLQMIPWDYNLAFGGFQSMGGATSLVNYPIDSPVSGGTAKDRPMIAWIFENEEYTRSYHQYFSELITEYFDSGYFSEMIDAVSAMIAPFVDKDPSKFCTYEEFEKGIATLKGFCLLRAESISGQLNGTIGTTSDTQERDTLIDADAIRVSDMGSMSDTMGGRKDMFNGNEQMPLIGADNDRMPWEKEDSIPQLPDGQMRNEDRGDLDGGPMQENAPPGFEKSEQGAFDGTMQRPDEAFPFDKNAQMRPQSRDTIPIGSLIVAGINVSVLALGLIAAYLFKRRR